MTHINWLGPKPILFGKLIEVICNVWWLYILVASLRFQRTKPARRAISGIDRVKETQHAHTHQKGKWVLVGRGWPPSRSQTKLCKRKRKDSQAPKRPFYNVPFERWQTQFPEIILFLPCHYGCTTVYVRTWTLFLIIRTWTLLDHEDVAFFSSFFFLDETRI